MTPEQLKQDIWAGTVDKEMHKHDFDGPWIEGRRCAECPPPLGAYEITRMDTAKGIVTIKTRGAK